MPKTIGEIFEKMPNYCEITYCNKEQSEGKYGVFEISWGETGRGFGTYTFVEDENGWSIDNECDDKETIKRIFCRLIDSLPLRDKTFKEMKERNEK